MKSMTLKTSFVLPILFTLLSFAPIAVHAADLEQDIHKINTIFKIKLDKHNIGSILTYCRPQFDKKVVVPGKGPMTFSVLAYVAHFGSAETLKFLAKQFESQIRIDHPHNLNDMRKARTYFYDTLAQAFEKRKAWEIVNAFLVEEVDERIVSMLVRRMIISLLKSENTFILNELHNESGKKSVHEHGNNVGIYQLQPALAKHFNSASVLKFVAKDIMEAFIAHHHDVKKQGEEFDLINVFIGFYDKNLPRFGRNVEPSRAIVFDAAEYLREALTSCFFEPEKQKYFGPLLEEIIQNLRKTEILVNTGSNIELARHDISSSAAIPSGPRIFPPIVQGADHLGDNQSKKRKLPIDNSGQPGLSVEIVDGKEPSKRPRLGVTWHSPFDCLKQDNKTCSLSVKVIQGNHPSDFVLNALTHCQSPELCTIDEKTIPTAIVMVGLKKFELFKEFLHARAFKTCGLDQECSDFVTVREAIFTFLLQQDVSSQSMAIELLADARFYGDDPRQLNKLKKIFFQAFFDKSISAPLLVKYFEVSHDAFPHGRKDSLREISELRKRIIDALVGTPDSLVLASLLQNKSFVGDQAQEIASSIFVMALEKQDYTLANELLSVGIVKLDQTTSF